MKLPNPIGIAAGFDKDAEAIGEDKMCRANKIAFYLQTLCKVSAAVWSKSAASHRCHSQEMTNHASLDLLKVR